MRAARLVYAGLAWIFVAVIIVQVFLIGVGLFGDASFRKTHIDFGYTAAGLAALALLIAAIVARPGRRAIGLAVLVFVLYVVQTILPAFKTDYPVIAALHPVNALLLFALAVFVARSATASIDSAV